MLTSLKEALQKVRGVSEPVIAVFVDIRGFSTFSKMQDSADVALYISKVYLKLIQMFEGISEDSFFKSTGDGLMMIFPFDEVDFERKFERVVTTCLECHGKFATLLKDVRIIDFETPSSIGFGISRGSACAIRTLQTNPSVVLDYSGHKVNLAARLQELARPSGIVIAGAHDVAGLPDAVRKRFKPAQVFVRSLAEKASMPIWHLETVSLQSINLRPLVGTWVTSTWPLKLDAVELVSYMLKEAEIDEKSISVRLRRAPNPEHQEEEGVDVSIDLISPSEYEYELRAGKPSIRIDCDSVKVASAKFLSEGKVGAPLFVDITYKYF